MKIQKKISTLTAVTLILSILAAAALTATGAILITGNTLLFAPQAKPTLTLSSNSTGPLYVGDTIQLTAQVTPTPATPAQVTFYVNGVAQTPTVATTNGIASATYKVTSETDLAIYPTATLG